MYCPTQCGPCAICKDPLLSAVTCSCLATLMHEGLYDIWYGAGTTRSMELRVLITQIVILIVWHRADWEVDTNLIIKFILRKCPSKYYLH